MKKLILLPLFAVLFTACCETFESTPYCYVSGEEYNYDYYYDDYYYGGSGEIEKGDPVYFRCSGTFDEGSVEWSVEDIATFKGSQTEKSFDEGRTYQYAVKYQDGCDKIQSETGTFTVYDFKRELLEGKWKMVQVKSTCSSTNTSTTKCNGENYDSIPAAHFLEFEDKMVNIDYDGSTSTESWNVYEEIAEGAAFNVYDIYGTITQLESDSLKVSYEGKSYYSSETLTSNKTWTFVKVP